MSGRAHEDIIHIVSKGLKKRRRTERIFRLCGLSAIGAALFFLFLLFAGIFSNGYSAFQQTFIRIDVFADPVEIRAGGLSGADYAGLVKKSLRDMFPDAKSRRDKRALYSLVSDGASYQLRERVLKDPGLAGRTLSMWVPADDDVDMLIKGRLDKDMAEGRGRLSDTQIRWIRSLESRGRIEKRFNRAFFVSGDSREPELAGILGALAGSAMTLLVTLLLSFPVGVAAAVYLEEFAPKNRWTDLIEININNLAAVPSIVFGLLGLAVFLNFFGVPRSVPLAGGLTLALMTLPAIIISSRASIQAVPPSIREAALGVGASKMQMALHHVFPLALPGMLTGAIIGMARALGETAPLLMIGMVAFIADIPKGFADPASALPVQIYLWADSPERAFVERTCAAIMALLVFLVAMNAAAVWLRKKFERRVD
ncbi:Phosphate transport system permease protein PstA [Candidatus Desulfarcum epimagneticum]|uniref:Phosphate transport system permease protein PstA n=1 Tax=uncultured Desulfobacteraceae bacterium TaxID=218296 RepID=A0A484HH68_9BACT|nr:Phosphate transport system permease protein PstA [uncultured Desulfobacteraceae bacterium]